MLKNIYLVLFFSLSFLVNASEFNLDIIVNIEGTMTPKDAEHLLELNGMEKAIFNKLKELKLDEELYKKKLAEKKLSNNMTDSDYFNFLASVVTRRETIRFAGLNPQIISEVITGAVKGELDDEKLKEQYIELTINADELKLKTLYVDIDLDLIGNTKWDDFGITNTNSFKNVLENSLKDVFGNKFPDFKKIIFIDNKLKETINENSKYVNNDSILLNYQINIKRSTDDLLSKKTLYEISAQYHVSDLASKNSLGVVELPVQKKLLQSVDKQELNSTVVSIIFNLMDSEIEKIKNLILNKKLDFALNIKLEGHKYFSEVYQVIGLIESNFKSQKVEVSITQLNLDKSEIKIKFPGIDIAHGVELLKTMDNLPLSKDPNEQKFLFFDAINKSFAIRPKA